MNVRPLLTLEREPRAFMRASSTRAPGTRRGPAVSATGPLSGYKLPGCEAQWAAEPSALTGRGAGACFFFAFGFGGGGRSFFFGLGSGAGALKAISITSLFCAVGVRSTPTERTVQRSTATDSRIPLSPGEQSVRFPHVGLRILTAGSPGPNGHDLRRWLCAMIHWWRIKMWCPRGA
jgi:hypothetical protein